MINEGPVDWGTAIIVGGAAGWMANKFMHAHARFGYVAVGVTGAVVLNALAEAAGFHYGGWLEFLVLGFFGACILLIPVRIVNVRTRTSRPPDDW
ncbi:GlsB/YeaQ/YmgE family stress response membrane protein [Rhizobium sp. LjRoot258]|jgi:uncharacterized membrane protein YeaQ/YmgE (transglycosylase-associated protein family)|uniref:GlsB/YeaQ/YmgE family stress response membrane protein n=1 Tax=Rhizobium sp. LjRoot258 TaxID=3342299 RepID=UPI003ECEAB03